MNITELKQAIHQGVGSHTFIDTLTDEDITDNVLVNSINVAQKRLARRSRFGNLKAIETMFLESGNNEISTVNNIRDLIFVALYDYNNEEYVSQVTDLDNGIYVGTGNTVYVIDQTSKYIVKSKPFDQFEKLVSRMTYQSGRPWFYEYFEPNKFIFDKVPEQDYFLRISCIKWPTLITTSDTTTEPDIQNADDLLILAALVWINSNMLQRTDVANQLYSQFSNELMEHNSVMTQSSNSEIYVRSRNCQIDRDDDNFPRPPSEELSASDLGV